jgi:hypothetical protein
VGHFFQRGKLFFTAAARIVKLKVGVVADVGKIIGVEESAVVGKLSRLVAVAEPRVWCPTLQINVAVSPGAKGFSRA